MERAFRRFVRQLVEERNELGLAVVEMVLAWVAEIERQTRPHFIISPADIAVLEQQLRALRVEPTGETLSDVQIDLLLISVQRLVARPQ